MILIGTMSVDWRSDKDGERRGAIRKQKSRAAEAGAGEQGKVR